MSNTFTDATQALAWVSGQAYTINANVYQTLYPEWDYGRLIYVDSTGPEWTPGILTYVSNAGIAGRADWQSPASKDVPLAHVGQQAVQREIHLAAIGYDYNIQEINTTIQIGGSLDMRKANAARLAYSEFLYRLTLFGDTAKGLGGIANYPGVITAVAPSDGVGGVSFWVDDTGTGTKTPAQIVRDINSALSGVGRRTNRRVLADTILMPPEALEYISSTPFSATTMETVLTFIQRTNLYTMTTGQPLTIRAVDELSTAGIAPAAGTGRLVAYNNSEQYARLLLPMPHRFLPVYQDGPLSFTVPGIFRTGGVEVMATETVAYLDGISQLPA